MHKALEASHTMVTVSQRIDARVPIIVGDLITGQAADVSYEEGPLNESTAWEGLQMAQEHCAAAPQLRPLLLLVKALLKQRGLNKVPSCRDGQLQSSSPPCTSALMAVCSKSEGKRFRTPVLPSDPSHADYDCAS